MLKDLPALDHLVEQLRRLPYLASKNVYRVAAHFLATSTDVDHFCNAVVEARRTIKPCKICFNWTQIGQSREHVVTGGLSPHPLCAICADQSRDHAVICVVESWHDLVSIERSGDFRGIYHVLGGALCPLEGIGPDRLTIESLIARVQCAYTTEIIFATNPTPEGEATASYIASKLKQLPIKLSRLASGIPTGSSLEYIDRITIHKALAGRQPF